MVKGIVSIEKQLSSTSKQEDEVIRILQVTDCHLYADTSRCLVGINTQESFEEVLTLAAHQADSSDLILATGDLVHDASPEGYIRLCKQLDAIGLPVYCIPGNHDIPEVMSRHMNSGRVSIPRNVSIGGWLVVLLDSTLPDIEGGHLKEEELQALEESLARHPDKHVLVTLHHHPIPVGSAWMDRIALNNPDQFLDIIDRYDNVRGVLWGHIHQLFDDTRNGVRMLGTPSTCIQFIRGQDNFAIDQAAPGYRWLELMPDGSIESGVQRLQSLPSGLDLRSAGY